MSSRVIRDGDALVEPLAWRAGGVAPSAATENDGGDPTAMGRTTMVTAPEPVRHWGHDFERELERRTQEAFQAGLQQGTSAARQQAQADVEARLQALARTTTEIASLRPQIRRETERELVELSLAIARRILHRELTVDPEALSALISAAMHKIDTRETHRLRTHPEHVAALSRCLAQIGAPAKIEVVADARLERGAAIFETSRGTLDASVDTQLAEIQHGFADLMGAEP